MEENSHIMIQNVMKLRKTKYYAGFVEAHQDSYRTLRGFIDEQLTQLGMSKEELARRLGTSSQIINRWEKKGFPSMEKALEMALALELGIDEVNDYLWKYAGMQDLSFVYETHFRYICVLIHQENLKKGYPRRDEETIGVWVERVINEVGSFLSMNASEGKQTGRAALQYLERYVKGSRFEKNYGNQAGVHRDVWQMDMIYNEDKKRCQWICKRMEKGKYPDKDELIELGLMLRMTRAQIDDLLKASGHYPLSAKNLYEGALIMVLTNLENLYPDQFKLGVEHDKPLELRMTVSRLVERCLQGIPDACKPHLQEKPKWYIPEKVRVLGRKQRCAAMLLDMEKHMLNTWIFYKENRDRDMEITCLLVEHVEEMLQNVGYAKLMQVEDDQMILEEIQKIEMFWISYMKKEGVLDIPKPEFRELCTGWMNKLEKYYLKTYAPKMKEKGKKINGI